MNLTSDDDMPPIREFDEQAFADVEDDDDMPPLVENPNPPMMYTFATNVTTLSYESPPPAMDDSSMPPLIEYPMPASTDSPPPPDADLAIVSPSSAGPHRSERQSHSRKRDASYIPRPPNAFILFRSSFVRAQRVPGKIEGNHSTLSKIVGMCWKNLPPEEKEKWEAKAKQAQAEHRKKYPDWRFRMANATNGLAKVKDGTGSGDGGGGGGGTAKKRGRRGGDTGKGVEDEDQRAKRCAKIVDLLGEGKTGSELAAAVEEYDRTIDNGVASAGRKSRSPNLKKKKSDITIIVDGVAQGGDPALVKHEREVANGAWMASSADPAFVVPVTCLAKRSSSAPAAPGRLPVLSLASLPAMTSAAFLSPEDVNRSHSGLTAPTNARKHGVGVDNMRQPAVSPRHFVAESANIAHNDAEGVQTGGTTPMNTATQQPIDAIQNVQNALHYSAPQEPSNTFLQPYLSSGALEFIQTAQPGAIETNTRRNTQPPGIVSSYSSLRGWAGGGNSAQTSPQTPTLSLHPDPGHASNDENYTMQPTFAAGDAAPQLFTGVDYYNPNPLYSGIQQDSPLVNPGGFAYAPALAPQGVQSELYGAPGRDQPAQDPYFDQYARGKQLMNILDLQAPPSPDVDYSATTGHGGMIDFSNCL